MENLPSDGFSIISINWIYQILNSVWVKVETLEEKVQRSKKKKKSESNKTATNISFTIIVIQLSFYKGFIQSLHSTNKLHSWLWELSHPSPVESSPPGDNYVDISRIRWPLAVLTRLEGKRLSSLLSAPTWNQRVVVFSFVWLLPLVSEQTSEVEDKKR